MRSLINRRWIACAAAAVMTASLFAGCGKAQKDSTPRTAPTETEAKAEESTVPPAPVSEGEKPETVFREYTSADGWKTSYDETYFTEEASSAGISFVFSDRSIGEACVSITYAKDRMPSEVLYDASEGMDPEKVKRYEASFTGGSDWAYVRQLNASDAVNGVGRTIFGIEHNGGTLLIDITSEEPDDEGNAIFLSDKVAEVLDFFEWTDHEPQTELAYITGEYRRTYDEEYEGEESEYTESITLEPDHTGIMSFQDDVPLNWTSTEILTDEGKTRQEFTVEGDMLYLESNGEWTEYERVGEPLPEYSYTGDDPVEKAIIEYMLEKNRDMYLTPDGAAMIPSFVIVRQEDGANAGEIRVYGNYWLFVYSKKGKTLFCESGGEAPAVFTLKKADGGEYQVTGYEQAGDDAQYAKDITRFAHGDKELEAQLFEAADTSKDLFRNSRMRYITEYVRTNGLDIDSYQDYGWEPVMLK